MKRCDNAETSRAEIPSIIHCPYGGCYCPPNSKQWILPEKISQRTALKTMNDCMSFANDLENTREKNGNYGSIHEQIKIRTSGKPQPQGTIEPATRAQSRKLRHYRQATKYKHQQTNINRKGTTTTLEKIVFYVYIHHCLSNSALNRKRCSATAVHAPVYLT